jgi:hypothetical protein
MELHKKIDTITQAFDDYLPEFWRSDNYRTDMAMTILDKDNRKWLDCFIGYIKWAKKNNLDKLDIRATISHDIGGLMRKDDCFLPRVSGYDNLKTI